MSKTGSSGFTVRLSSIHLDSAKQIFVAPPSFLILWRIYVEDRIQWFYHTPEQYSLGILRSRFLWHLLHS